MVNTDKGRAISADVVFFCHGSSINRGCYEETFKGSMTEWVCALFANRARNSLLLRLWILAEVNCHYLFTLRNFYLQGELKVNARLQVDGYKNVFAIGDCSNREAKLGFLAGMQGYVTTHSLL